MRRMYLLLLTLVLLAVPADAAPDDARTRDKRTAGDDYAGLLQAQATPAQDSKKGSAKGGKKSRMPRKNGERKNATERGRGKANPLTPERVERVRKFLRKHQPQLVAMLESLEGSQPRRFNAAVRDLSQAYERLERTRKRDARAYRLELQRWKLKIDAQVLGARLRMAPENSELVEQLRTTLRKRSDIELQILKRNRERHLQRVKRTDEQIRRFTANVEKSIERQIANHTRVAKSKRSGAKKTIPTARRDAQRNKKKQPARKRRARENGKLKTDD